MDNRESPSHSLLITGGSGYIGSIIIYELLRTTSASLIVLDRRVNDTLMKMRGAKERVSWIEGEYGDYDLVKRILKDYSITTVIHLAAFIEVGASLMDPAAYYENNVAQLSVFMAAIKDGGVQLVIAASSSAVYGTQEKDMLQETDPCQPDSPYGRTKVALEWMMQDYATAYRFSYGIFRYTNVAGACPLVGLGECHLPETHLIPQLLTACSKGDRFMLYGTDHPTPDGTCVRDFVHVYDVARAHTALLAYYQQTGFVAEIFNIATGIGSSVAQVVEKVAQVMGKGPRLEWGPRRPGDPASIVASPQKAHRLLGWQPLFSSLQQIIEDGARFQQCCKGTVTQREELRPG